MGIDDAIMTGPGIRIFDASDYGSFGNIFETKKFKLLQQIRVDIWSSGKSHEELKLNEKEVLELGIIYAKQPHFVGKIAAYNKKLAGYGLGYETIIDEINLAKEIVVSPLSIPEFRMSLKKQFGITGERMMIVNGLGVLPCYRNNPLIVKSLISELLRGLRHNAYESGVPVIMFYTWKHEEHPDIYKKHGFEKLYGFLDRRQPDLTYWFLPL